MGTFANVPLRGKASCFAYNSIMKPEIDEATARKVGARHGQPAILRIRAGAMFRAGSAFFCSENGVWLTDSVPVEHIEFP